MKQLPSRPDIMVNLLDVPQAYRQSPGLEACPASSPRGQATLGGSSLQRRSPGKRHRTIYIAVDI